MKIEVEKCTQCERAETARWYYKTTPNPICCPCYRKNYVKKNRAKALAAQRKANRSDKSKKARKDYESKASSKEARKYRGRFYDSIRRKRTHCSALGLQFKEEIQEIYRNCPEGHQVDHIIPIKGKKLINGEWTHILCGLHVPWNLQYLTVEENRLKYYKVDYNQEDA
tara:strand:+ start:1473 stop:1976 length:504 start_codon:yes stop_codon:yes gene_type:complete